MPHTHQLSLSPDPHTIHFRLDCSIGSIYSEELSCSFCFCISKFCFSSFSFLFKNFSTSFLFLALCTLFLCFPLFICISHSASFNVSVLQTSHVRRTHNSGCCDISKSLFGVRHVFASGDKDAGSGSGASARKSEKKKISSYHLALWYAE